MRPMRTRQTTLKWKRTPNAASVKPPARRGKVLFLAIGTLFIVGALTMELVQTSVRNANTQQFQLRHDQAEWLAEAGCNRAALQLKAKPAYTGETWEVAATELDGTPGRVEIKIAPESAGRGRQVTVTADFPRDLPARQRVVKTFSLAAAARTP